LFVAQSEAPRQSILGFIAFESMGRLDEMFQLVGSGRGQGETTVSPFVRFPARRVAQTRSGVDG
jgi:hypothetical protein